MLVQVGRMIIVFQAVTVVTVHMNGKADTDVPPRFDQSRYQFTVFENARPARIGRVQAYHPGGRVEYSLTESSPYFAINNQTGELEALTTFDYETQRNYSIQVIELYCSYRIYSNISPGSSIFRSP
jgi:hypothetical protein